jgi:glyoxylase-like metal-dependent hydrolase (beta-lactamase superfamily II)
MPSCRRPLATFLTALGLAFASVAATAPLTAHAAAPLQKSQVPGYYRLNVGEIEVTALFDGVIQLDTKLLKHASEADIQKLLARMFVRGPKVQTAVNAYLVNSGGKLVLIDTGAAKLFGPSLGHILANLKAAGHQPEQIDAVLLTHLHGDHTNGLLLPDGKPAFPNAEVWAAQADADYWLSAEVTAKAPDAAKPFFRMAQAAVAPYQQAGKFKTFSAAQDILPGIRSLPTVGHTPGHTAYDIQSGGERLIVWGDLVHNASVQFAKPSVSIEFDVNQQQAIATRKAFFAQVAKDKTLVAGMHLAFPGIGHLRAEGKGYTWVPLEFAPLGE